MELGGGALASYSQDLAVGNDTVPQTAKHTQTQFGDTSRQGMCTESVGVLWVGRLRSVHEAGWAAKGRSSRSAMLASYAILEGLAYTMI
jgi:hypothetical protein